MLTQLEAASSCVRSPLIRNITRTGSERSDTIKKKKVERHKLGTGAHGCIRLPACLLSALAAIGETITQLHRMASTSHHKLSEPHRLRCYVPGSVRWRLEEFTPRAPGLRIGYLQHQLHNECLINMLM